MSATLKPLSSAISAAAGGHHRLARAHVALQQPPHRMRARSGPRRISRRTLVCAPVELEAERAPGTVSSDDCRRRTAAPGRLVSNVSPATLDLDLQLHELIQRQPSRAPVSVSARVSGKCSMRIAWARVGQGEASSNRDGLGPGLRDLALTLIQRPPDERAQPALRQPFGERVNRSRGDPKWMNRVFAVFHDFRFRVVHRARLEWPPACRRRSLRRPHRNTSP